MKTWSLVAALAAAAISPSIASAQNVHPLVGIALTEGGDKLATLYYSNNTSSDVRAGGLVYVYGGFEVRPEESPFAFQGTLGYHFDNAGASNGDIRFDRFPVEGTVLWRLDPHVRIGAGIRYSMSPRLTSSGAGSLGQDYNFNSQLAPLVQFEYLFNEHMGLQVRYVQEKYTTQGPNSVSIDGSHGGIGFNYYF
jgi:hypothetical protein